MIGDEIRNERLQAGMSQERLAEIAGIHRTYVSLIERKKKDPTMRVFIRLCRALHVRSSDVMKRIEKRRLRIWAARGDSRFRRSRWTSSHRTVPLRICSFCQTQHPRGLWPTPVAGQFDMLVRNPIDREASSVYDPPWVLPLSLVLAARTRRDKRVGGINLDRTRTRSPA